MKPFKRWRWCECKACLTSIHAFGAAAGKHHPFIPVEEIHQVIWWMTAKDILYTPHKVNDDYEWQPSEDPVLLAMFKLGGLE